MSEQAICGRPTGGGSVCVRPAGHNDGCAPTTTMSDYAAVAGLTIPATPPGSEDAGLMLSTEEMRALIDAVGRDAILRRAWWPLTVAAVTSIIAARVETARAEGYAEGHAKAAELDDALHQTGRLAGRTDAAAIVQKVADENRHAPTKADREYARRLDHLAARIRNTREPS